MPDPKYGATSAGFAEALGRTLAAAEALEKALARLTTAEAASTRVVQGNAGARVEATAAMRAQAEAAGAIAAAVGVETRAMEANTAAWRVNAAARAATGIESQAAAATAGRGARYGASTTGIGSLDIAASERAGAANAAARLGAEERFFAQRSGRFGTARPPGTALPFETPGVVPGEDPQLRRALQGAYLLPQQQGPRLLGAGPPVVPGPPVVTVPPGVSSAEAFSEGEQKLIRQGAGLAASNATLAESQLAVNSAFRVSVAEVAASSSALQRHGALTAEFIQAFARGEVTLAEFGSQLTTTIGKFAGWAVAGGLVYGAVDALKTLTRGAVDTASGINKLERTGVPINRAQAAEGFRQLSAETNVPVGEAVNAQFFAIRSGFHDQAESLSVAKTILLAYKLDLVSVADAARSFGNLHRTMGLDAKGVASVFNELDQGQRQYNARLQQTLPQLGRAASSWAEAGGSAKGLVSAIVAINSATGGGGGTGGGNPATAILRLPANIEKPLDQYALRDLGINPVNPKTGSARNAEEILLGRGQNAIRGRIESGDYSDAQVRKLAEALGQPAVGLRYFAPLLQTFKLNPKTGQSEFTEIEKGVRKPGSAAEDLEKQLSQLDERFKAIGNTFNRIGSELSSIGLTGVLDNIVGAFLLASTAAEKLLGPLGAVGQAFNGLPGALQETLVLGGLGLGGARLLGRAGGLRRPVGELPGLGFLDTQSAKDLREARATVRKGVEFNATDVERRSQASLRANAAALDAQSASEEFQRKNASQFAALRANPEYAKTPKFEKLIGEGSALETERVAAANRAQVATEQLTRAKLRLLEEEKLQTFVDDRRVAASARLSAVGAVAPLGAPTSAAILGAEGGLGSTVLAQQILAERGGAGGVPFTASSSSTRSARARAEAAAAETQVRATAQAASEGGLTDALGLVYGGAVGGAAASVEGAALRAKGLGERAATTAAKATHGFGDRAVKGLMTAYLGIVGAEIAGERLGLGSGAQSILTSTALGGAAGQVLGIGGFRGAAAGLGYGLASQGGGAGGAVGGAFLGAAVGGALSALAATAPVAAALDATGIGLPAGLALSGIGAAVGGVLGGLGVFGSGKKTPTTSPLQKREDEARLNYVKGDLTRAHELEPIGREFAKELDQAFSGTGETAQKAMQSVAKAVGNSAAAIKVFGIASDQGRTAARNLREEAAVALSHAANNAAFTEEASKIYLQTSEALVAGTGEWFKTYLTTTPLSQHPKAEHDAVASVRAQTLGDYEQRHSDLTAEGTTIEARRAALAKYIQEEKQRGKIPGTDEKYGKNLPELEANAEKNDNALKALEATYPKRLQQYYEAIQKFAQESGAQEQAAIKGRGALARGEAGTNPEALRAAARNERRELLEGDRKRARTTEQKEALKVTEHQAAGEELTENTQRTREGAEGRDIERQRGLAGIGGRFPVARAEAQKRIAEEEANEARRLGARGGFKPNEIKELGNKVIESNVAFAEAAYDEQKSIVDAQTQIAQASHYGDAIAQAQAAISGGGQLLAIAKTPLERYQAQLAIINGENQLFQAHQDRIGEQGAVRESRTGDPLAKDRIKIQTIQHQLRTAKPDETLKLTADLNNERRKYLEDQATEAQDLVQYELTTHQISPAQAVVKYQQVLHKLEAEHASARQIRAIKQKIYETETNQIQELVVGNIRLPTYFGARTLTAVNQARAGLGSSGAYGYTAIPVSITNNHTTHVSATYHVHGAHNAEETAHALHKHLKTLTKANRRTARYTR